MWKNNCNFVFTHHTQGCLLANFFVAVNAAVHIKRNVAEKWERERKRLRVVLLRYSRWKSWFKSRFAVRAQPPRLCDCWSANLTDFWWKLSRGLAAAACDCRWEVAVCSENFPDFAERLHSPPHPRLIACSSSQFVGVLLVAGKKPSFFFFFSFYSNLISPSGYGGEKVNVLQFRNVIGFAGSEDFFLVRFELLWRLKNFTGATVAHVQWKEW